MSDILIRNDIDGVCTLTLNRPDKLNALDSAMFERLDAELAALETRQDDIGCVVLRGNGRAFCAGADLTPQSPGTPAAPTYKPGVIERMSRLPQPVVACIHGACVTGGLELALAADIIVAAESARFADTHGRWGFVAGWGMTQRLPRRVGTSFAKLMMMTGRPVTGPEALRAGLVDLCIPDETLDAELSTLVKEILANSWHTNRATKKLLIETEGLRLADGLAHEHYRYPGLAPDHKQRLASFARKG